MTTALRTMYAFAGIANSLSQRKYPNHGSVRAVKLMSSRWSRVIPFVPAAFPMKSMFSRFV